MHPLFEKADKLSYDVIGAAVEVHRLLGPGLLESIYERCLCYELETKGFTVTRQQKINVAYKNLIFEELLRLDLLVEGCLLIELKSVEQVNPIYKAQALSYMKLLNVPVGLLINFTVQLLTDGVNRLILPRANL